MELLKLSKFKLQLQSMIEEVRDLRERERLVTDHIGVVNQKRKQTEEEYSRKVQELQAELATSRETQEALERKVSYLENDYSLLENKQNELKTTIQNLLQSRESFLNDYQESFCEMKRSIEARDRKIAILHEKLTSHLTLFDSIEKEASLIKKVIQEVQDHVDQKEDVVTGLKEKMDHVATYEKVFIEKIRSLEEKNECHGRELQTKENIISELSAQLEAEKIKNEHQHQFEELQKILQVKDLVVANLVAEKEALHSEVKGLEMILQRIQESVSLMTEEDRRVFTSVLTFEQGAGQRSKRARHNDTVEKMEDLLCEAPVTHSPENSELLFNGEIASDLEQSLFLVRFEKRRREETRQRNEKEELQSMIEEVRDLRERERLVTDHISVVNQKRKQTEEEYSRKVQELQAELATSRETQEALERKVSYLENDYSLLENKQNELKTTIQNLLQSRESFLNDYQESFCEMKRSIEARDRKIAILHEKLTSHLTLFDSIEKEASLIKKVIQEVQDHVDQKEDVVTGLKEKMDHVATYEKVFIEKIRSLEEKNECHERELQTKENIISELSAQLEVEKIKNEHQHQVEELQKILQVKDLVVANLVTEKEALHSEVKSLEMILQRIQESASLMTEEDRRVFTSILTFEQGANESNKRSRQNDTVDKMEELLCEAPVTHYQEHSVKVMPSVSPRCQHQNTDCRSIRDNDHQMDSAAYLQHDTVNGNWQSNHNHSEIEDKCKELVNQPDSECSTNRL